MTIKQLILVFIFCFVLNDWGIAQNFQHYYTAANEWRAKGDYWQAIIDYTEAINLNPQSALVYAERGYCHSKRKEHTQALADYNQAIALHFSDPLVFLNRGWASYNLGHFHEACLDWRMAEQMGFPNLKATLEKYCR